MLIHEFINRGTIIVVRPDLLLEAENQTIRRGVTGERNTLGGVYRKHASLKGPWPGEKKRSRSTWGERKGPYQPLTEKQGTILRQAKTESRDADVSEDDRYTRGVNPLIWVKKEQGHLVGEATLQAWKQAILTGKG